MFTWDCKSSKDFFFFLDAVSCFDSVDAAVVTAIQYLRVSFSVKDVDIDVCKSICKSNGNCIGFQNIDTSCHVIVSTPATDNNLNARNPAYTMGKLNNDMYE